MRSTLMDVAREAGVSSATVDRVLNGRTGVKPRTRDVVLDAARRLGYVAAEPLGTTPLPGTGLSPVRLDFVLPAGSNSFMLKLGAELRTQAVERADIDSRLHLIEGFNPDTLASKLGELEGRTGGVGVVAIDHPTVRDAIRNLARSGVPIVTLVSDIQHVPRVGYVGIDNRSAGRLAGYIMFRFLGPGHHKVALFAGSVSYRGHEEREMGFRHIVSEHPDNIEIVSFSEIRDDDERAYEATRQHLAQHADLSAIYNIGAGNRGIARALEESGRAGQVVFVGHDLTEYTKQYLLSGVMDAVIDQNPRVEAREALEQLYRANRGLGWSAHPLRTQIIVKENLPDEFT
ncbi:MAG: LacI family DNA-binding transcriptional regulator [Devosia nanyangense]|uniref:LacI family DNA-binding transcriptional regulator n=1 Tax=Devosia nanyangense TaxID=1228055 RepID=A0A933NYG4_9HYPH|nr:LacI family DNA-binding transcriptional regulator [Devosia nanyangense]